ncbi:hypothetical protein [Bremerella sp.]|uniref:hypothetical protein n=1 Tax=Bremerella sp. TaxID=2795602 RepID=UPI00391BB0F8
MHTNHEPTQPSGANAPQVVVRAGKTFVCSSCGTLVEIPAEVVGQLVLAAAPASQDMPGGGSPPEVKEPAQNEPERRERQAQPTLTQQPSRQTASAKPRTQRPKRPQRPQPELFTGTMIDGLRVPSGQQLDRALKWVSFHLRVLDRQSGEIKRLQTLLKQPPPSRVPRPSPLGRASETQSSTRPEQKPQPNQEHAHEDVSMAPESQTNKPKGREPP